MSDDLDRRLHESLGELPLPEAPSTLRDAADRLEAEPVRTAPPRGRAVLRAVPALAVAVVLVGILVWAGGSLSTGADVARPGWPLPSGAPLGFYERSFDSPLAGSHTTDGWVSFRTLPGATCTMVVRYHGVPTSIPGVEPKTAPSSDGIVEWRWPMPEPLPLPPSTFTVTCVLGSQTATWTDYFDGVLDISPGPTSPPPHVIVKCGTGIAVNGRCPDLPSPLPSD